MKRIHALIFALSLIITSLAIPPTAFSTHLSKIDEECVDCHSEYEAFEVIIDSPSEVPENFDFEYKVIVRNNEEHEVQDLRAFIDLSEAEFLETDLVGGEPYHEEISDSVGVFETATFSFPVAIGATGALVVLDGEDGIIGLNDLDMTVEGPNGSDGSANSGADEAVSINAREIRSWGYGDYFVNVVWFVGNPSISFTLTIDVEYSADQIYMEGPNLAEGEDYTFIIPFTSTQKGDNTITVEVRGTAYHDHEDEDPIFVDSEDAQVEETSNLKVGSKLVYNAPSDDERSSFNVLLYERVLGLLSALILIISIGFSGLLKPVSSRLEKLVGGASQRTKWHCRVSQVLLLLALIHGMLLAVSPHSATLRGLLLGTPAFIIMGFLGYIGWKQNILRPQWGNKMWKKVHLIFTILLIILVILHALLDGSDFAWLR
jgi:hypothetical protein